jgi:hypothetical protein
MRTNRDSGSTRTTGLVVAVAVALAAVGGLGWLVLSRSRPAETNQSKGVDIPQDIMEMPSANAAQGFTGAGTGKGVRVELADRKDPTRTSAMIECATLTPLEAKRYAMERPVARFFLRDGRVAIVSADRGVVTWPSRDQAPERGTFEGSVRVEIAPTGQPEPGTPQPDEVVFQFEDRLDFDSSLGEMSTPGMIRASVGPWKISGADWRVLLDEPRSGVQLALVKRDVVIESTGSDTPAKHSPKESGAGQSPAPDKDAIETIYRTVFPSSVSLSLGGRKVDAPRAEVFVRLVGNALRDGAIATFDEPTGDPPEAKNGEAAPTSKPERAMRLSSPDGFEIRPMETAPDLLAADDVVVKLGTREAASPVAFADPGSRANGVATEASYAATRGMLTLTSDRVGGVRLESERDGVLEASALTANLRARVVGVVGAGVLTSAAKGDEDPRLLSWREQADFVFYPGRQWEIASADLSGLVVARDRGASAEAATVRAKFDRGSLVSRVDLVGGAVLRDGKAGLLSAETMQIAFATESGRSVPSLLTASGLVEARRSPELLSAGFLEATLGEDDKGRTSVVKVFARETVNFAGKNNVTAFASELRADVPSETATLIGANSTIGQDSSSVVGPLIRVAGKERSISVEGPGRFETTDDQGLHARATWTESMSYTDTTGILTARGSAQVRALRSDTTIDTVNAAEVRVELEPKPAENDAPPGEGSAEAPAKAAEDPAGPPGAAVAELNGDSILAPGDRRLLRAKAAGSDQARATVESRRYDAPVSLDGTEGAKAVQVLYLEGTQIEADNVAGTLIVPTPGRALSMDRRATQDAAASPGSDLFSGGARGTALFEWAGSMRYERSSGSLTMLGGSKATHQRPAEGMTLYLESQSLSALIEQGENVEGRLVSAEATGSVFASSKPAPVTGPGVSAGGSERQLSADRLMYDALLGTMRVFAAPGAEVTVFDAANATPVRAAEILWDLGKDRVEVVRPSPIVTPR